MPFVCEPTSRIGYFLLSCDKQGDEQEDIDGDQGLLSQRIIRELNSDSATTDVFILCHGWLVDAVSAKKLYDDWIRCFCELHLYKRNANSKVPNFNPMIIAIHWPSRPLAQHLTDEYSESVDWLADLIGEIPDYLRRKGRSAIDLAHNLLSDLARKNKTRLPHEILSAAVLLTSYFKVKTQAQTTGEKFVSKLIGSIGKNNRRKIHCIGHSFGALVLASALVQSIKSEVKVSVQTLYCIQGALSLWSFCLDLPGAKSQPGKFRSVIRNRIIEGQFLVTYSRHDKALGWAYPNAMRILDSERWNVRSVYPAYGALGAFGARGYKFVSIDMKMLPVDDDYKFQNSIMYNLDSEAFIKGDTNTGGDAHNNILQPEVANALWQAVFNSDIEYDTSKNIG